MRHRFGGGDEVGEAHPLVGRWQLLIDGCRPDRIARSEYRALAGLCCRHRRCQDGHASLTLTEAGPEAFAQRDRCCWIRAWPHVFLTVNLAFWRSLDPE